jgi:hypothetical protein
MGIGQPSVAIEMAAGFPGQPYLSGPHRAQPGTIVSAGTTYPNYVGYAYTASAGNDGECVVGGTGDFYGILINPQNFPLFGTSAGALAPTLALPQYSPGEFEYEGTAIWVTLPAAANVGDLVDYNTTTGAIVTRAKTGSVTGSVTSNVLTVTVADANGNLLEIGSVVTTSAGVATVESLGTYSGGTGTLNLSTIPNSSSGAVTFSTGPAAGNANIKDWKVLRFNIPSAGIGLIGTKVS